MNFRSIRRENAFSKIAPHSRMVFPSKLLDQVKYIFWHFFTPFHPLLRDVAVKFGLITHTERQNFYLGKVAPNYSIEEIVAHLVSQGYGNHFVALYDPDEVVSLRQVQDFVYQYHIRIFKDGEVRGHYEYTPECRPILHMRKVGQEDRRDEFLKILGDRII